MAAATSAPTPATLEAPSLEASENDAALREIYARETSSHVAVVRTWLVREQPHPAPHVLTEEVYRACHTLSGSSKMAEARHGIRLAEPLNHWLRKSFDSGIGLDDSDLVLLSDCMGAMEAVAGHLDENTIYFVVHDTLRARIARAEMDLERRIAEAAEHTGRTGIHSLPMLQSLQHRHKLRIGNALRRLTGEIKAIAFEPGRARDSRRAEIVRSLELSGLITATRSGDWGRRRLVSGVGFDSDQRKWCADRRSTSHGAK